MSKQLTDRMVREAYYVTDLDNEEKDRKEMMIAELREEVSDDILRDVLSPENVDILEGLIQEEGSEEEVELQGDEEIEAPEEGESDDGNMSYIIGLLTGGMWALMLVHLGLSVDTIGIGIAVVSVVFLCYLLDLHLVLNGVRPVGGDD